MTSQPGQKTIGIHILINISGHRSNQVEFNIRNTFLKNHTQDVEKLFPDLFLQNQKHVEHNQ